MTEDQWAELARELVKAVQDLGNPSLADWISAGSAFLTLIVAGAALWFARGQLKEAAEARKQTRELEREKAQPYVVAFIEENEVGPEIFDLVVKNFGQTAAKNVRLAFDPPLMRTGQEEGSQELVALPQVISFLAPGQEWRTIFDFMINRANRPDMTMTYRGTVTYDGIGDERRSSDVVIDLEVQKPRLYTRVYGIHEAAEALQEISKEAKSWSEGVGGGVKVYARNGDVKDAAQAERWRRRSEQIKARQAAEAAQMDSGQGSSPDASPGPQYPPGALGPR